MKKLFLLPLLIIFGLSTYATDYYIAANGNDGNNGTSSSSPWQTINKLNAYFSYINSGDRVFFRRGDTFYGTIKIGKSGTSGSPITLGAYGSGENPVISGLSAVTSWNNLGGNIWESSNAVSSLPYTNMVLVDGVTVAMGRWPNTGYLYYQSHNSNISITSSGLIGSQNWTGAEVAMFVTTYGQSRNKILSQSGTTINYQANPISESIQYENQGFFIQNDSRTLDSPGEWYYNPSTKKLRLYSLGTPNNVQLTTVDTLLITNEKSYITVENIAFKGSNRTSFLINNSKYISINNCDFNFSGTDAITGPWWGNSTNVLIQGCTFNNTNSSAISLVSEFNNAVIKNNSIKNTGMVSGMGGKGEIGNCFAIHAPGINTLIDNNSIENVGYIPITFQGSNTVISNNYIDGFCLILHDGAGIYTHNATPVSQSGIKIQNNIVLNGLTDCGIYVDENSNGIDVLNNSVSGCNIGIYLHNSWNVKVNGNTTYNNKFAEFYIYNDNPNVTMQNIELGNNKFVAKEQSQRAVFAYPLDRLIAGLNAHDNYYARPIDDNAIMDSYYLGVWGRRTLAEWKVITGQDILSKGSPKSISSVDELRFEYNPTSSNKSISLDANYIDVSGKTYSGVISLTPHTSLVLIRNGAITNQTPVANAGGDQSINLPVNSVNLQGSGNDSDGTIDSYNWSKSSGPENFVIADINLPSTKVSGLTEGVYQFLLKVTDNKGSVGQDIVEITVKGNDILLAAVNPSPIVSGLDYEYYEGTGYTGVPNFSELTNVKKGTTADFNVSMANRTENFALNFNGFIEVPTDGQYTFYTNSDDGSLLYIDGKMVVNNDGLHGESELSGTIGLKAGKHAISVGFFQGTGAGILKVSYSGPGIAKSIIPLSRLFRITEESLLPAVNPANTINGLDYQYYEGTGYTLVPNFSGLTAIKTGTTTDFNVSMANRPENYALNFNGFIEVPTDGQYTFYTNSDDGSLLYIDGKLVVNNDGLHGSVELSGKVGLKAGKHAISVGFFQGAGAGILNVSYSGPGIFKTIISQSQLFRISDENLLPAINPSNPVNGLDYQYYEGSGYAVVPDFTGLTATKTGSTTDFNVSMANRQEIYALNFTGYIDVPTDGQYTFYTNSDDGSLLYIDGRLVVNNDGLHAAVELSGKIGLKAGKHAISVGFIQQTGASVLSVSYSGPGVTKQKIPSTSLYRVVDDGLLPAVYVANSVNGIDYQYYEGSGYTVVPKFSGLPIVKIGTTPDFNVAMANRSEIYALNFNGYIDVPTDGQYTFYSNSDDGSLLYIDGRLVVNNDGLHGALELSGSIGLKAGKHVISVGFFQQTGAGVLNVSFSGPGVAKQKIPSTSLYRAVDDGLLSAVYVDNPVNGLDYQYYEESSFTSIPNFSALSPVKSGTTSNFLISLTNRAETYAFNFTGYINIPTDGLYTFYTTSDDGSNLYVDGRLVVNNDALQWPVEKSGTIGLKAGYHAISVGYFNQTGTGTLIISYAGPGVAKQAIASDRLVRSSVTQFAITGGLNMSKGAPSNVYNDEHSLFKTEVKAYPNPFVNSVNLSIISKPGKYKLILLDVLGRILWSKEGNKGEGLLQQTINTSSLQKGIYFLKVIQDGKGSSLKLEK
ncbi:MAG: PA14 domain-containing protein [Ginsengibacter sp.]